MLIAFLQVSATTLAQKVTLSATNAPLSTIFNQVKKQTGYDFAFTGKVLEQAKPVTIHVKNEELKDVLQKIFDGQPLDYTIEDKSVTVTIKQPNILDKLKAALHLNTIDVTGKITDETGQPLPAATVIVKGTSNSTITDAKGNFALKHVDNNAVLKISFIGYLTKEVNASSDLSNVKMEVANSKLDEVQVIAYGTTNDRLSTGDVTTVSAKAIEEQPVANPLLALEGRVPGLFVTQTTGLPGAGVFMQIRGQNSLGQGNDPFYVVDGVPYTSLLLPNLGNILGQSDPGNTSGNPLSFINPDDIESISVLKDADATSIYGSRAANGAILITTKKGKAGETKVNANLQNGWGQVADMLPVMNTQQYLKMRHEALNNDAITPSLANGDYDLLLWDTTRNTNWQKKLIGGTAQYMDYNASVSGGSANTQFLVGSTYHRETTVFPGNFSDEKAAIHFNINSTVLPGAILLRLPITPIQIKPAI